MTADAGGLARCEFIHNSTSMSQELLAAVRRKSGPRLLLDERIGNGPFTKRDIAAFESTAPPEILRNEFWDEMHRSGWLESGAHSASVGIMSGVVREFMARVPAAPLPLLVDGIIGQLDSRAARFCADLLQLIGRTSQVIVVTSSYAGQSFGKELIRLPRHASPLRAMAYYAKTASFTSLRLQTRKRSRERMKTFKLGETFPTQESRACELKEVKGQNPVGSIGQVADQYVVAFLNAGVEQTGSILWGVTDARTVVGVPLTDAQCDEIRRVVVGRVGNIKPPLALTTLSIKFHPVASDGPSPLYVAEVKVPAVQGTYLYATGSEEGYVKTDAGKKKLTIMQIQQELLQRRGVGIPAA
ncbi:hypothetical protein J2789_004883 [Variovorax paradoxus]|nr:hypothetical protein [Variovorax paradoxus]